MDGGLHFHYGTDSGLDACRVSRDLGGAGTKDSPLVQLATEHRIMGSGATPYDARDTGTHN